MKITVARTFFMLFLAPILLFAHSEHQEKAPPPKIQNQESTPEESPDSQEKKQHDHSAHSPKEVSGYTKFIKWIGHFHPISIHFPVALLVMTGFAELLFLWFPSPIFSNASRFMVIAAAISSIPTVLFGLAYGYDANYTGALSSIFWWHRFSGISTAILAVITATLKELYVRKRGSKIRYYYTALIASILFVTVTGYLGGEMTFGLFHLFPK